MIYSYRRNDGKVKLFKPKLLIKREGGEIMKKIKVRELPLTFVFDDRPDAFLLCEVYEKGGFKGENKVILAVGRCYHLELERELRKQLERLGIIQIQKQKGSVKIIGGGRINFYPLEKEIVIYGFSASYGEESDREITKKILQETFNDFSVKIR